MVPMVLMVVVGRHLRLAVARGRWCRTWWYGAYGADGGGGASPPTRGCAREGGADLRLAVARGRWCRTWWYGAYGADGGGGASPPARGCAREVVVVVVVMKVSRN